MSDVSRRPLNPQESIRLQNDPWLSEAEREQGAAVDEQGQPTEGMDGCEVLIAAVDRLVQFVTERRGNRPRDDYLELLRLDQEVSAASQAGGLSPPSISYEGTYGDSIVGFCRIPATRHTGGCHIYLDQGWLISMRGFRRAAELKRERPRSRKTPPDQQETSSPPKTPSSSGRCSPPDSGGDADPTGAARLWDRDPVLAFERLRDKVCDATHLVVEIHRQALAAPPDESLANVGPELHEPLREAIVAAQGVWLDTPITRFLERPDPVHLDRQETRIIGRISGSCNHDLVLGLAVGLWRWIEEGLTAHDYVAAMRYYTFAGDHVGEHLASLIPLVRCECQDGITRWRQEKGQDVENGIPLQGNRSVRELGWRGDPLPDDLAGLTEWFAIRIRWARGWLFDPDAELQAAYVQEIATVLREPPEEPGDRNRWAKECQLLYIQSMLLTLHAKLDELGIAGYPHWRNDPEGDARWFFTANDHFSRLLSFLRQSLQKSPRPGRRTKNVGDRNTGGADDQTDDKPASREELIQQLRPAARLAYLTFCYAESKKGKSLKDQEAYELLKEEGIPQGTGELEEYPLPQFGSWARYLREARNVLDEQKYSRKAGRTTGKSIARGDQIEHMRDADE